MIKLRHWHSMPAATVREALPRFTWQKVDTTPPSAGTAALMLWIALRFMAEKVLDEFNTHYWVSSASYDALGEATGLSRSLIAHGLKRLEGLQLITPEGTSQKRRYKLRWEKAGWFKLPCQAIVSDGVIKPFKTFTLRSKHELHALKLYLYLAAVRDNNTAFSSAAYETIFKNTGIPERDIPRAINVLNACGLMARVHRETDGDTNVYGPNKYYLAGYRGLFIGPESTAALGAEQPSGRSVAELLG